MLVKPVVPTRARVTLCERAEACYPEFMLPQCSLSEPPRLEEGKVVLHVVHEPSGQVFRCELSNFDDVVVDTEPRDLTPSPEGDARGEAAEAALEYARENRDEFAQLFAQL